MTIKTNYHTHNDFCDGEGAAEEYVVSAVDKGFSALGFSSHAPIPVENPWTLTEASLPLYLAEVDRLKEKWKDRIQIYKGLEIDYIPGSQAPGDPKWDALGLDYRIGSVHNTVGLERDPEYRGVDGPIEGLEWLIAEVHGGSFEDLCEHYYARVAELAELGGFDFLGHFDLVKKRNGEGKYFSEEAPWYRRQVKTALDAVAANGVVMEVNSGAISRGALDEVYPSAWILAEARRLGIPMMVNADAHSPDAVDCNFDESIALLKDTGYRDVRVLLDGEWKDISI